MKLSILISFFIHFLIFLSIQIFHEQILQPEPYMLYRAELISADILEKEYEKLKKAPEEKDETIFSADLGEITISLNTTDEKFKDYAKMIKEKIQENWIYPAEAKKKGIEGRTLIFFSLDRDGRLMGIRIKSSSGNKLLDDEAKRAIHSSAPFPPFPGQLMFTKLNIVAEFDYVLK